jgi:hypothetical protein
MDCPHCGGVIDPGGAKPLADSTFDDRLRCLVVDGQRRRVTPAEWRLLSALRERFRRWVPVDFLCQATACDARNGGSDVSLRVRILYLRRQLDGTPFAIASGYAIGYGLFPAAEVWVEPCILTGRKHYRLRPGPSRVGDGGIGSARRASP